jgi:RNA polymerase sigma-70 factor (ECF subfamily)
VTVAVDRSILPRPAAAFASFEEGYELLAPVAYRAAFRLLGDREGALDVAQDAMAKLVTRWADVAVHPTPEGWAVTVATRLVLGGWRKRSGLRPGLRPASTQGTESPESPAVERADLVAALRRLPKRQREVAVLLYVADLPVAAVAAALGCSDGTVKQHASRARTALRASLATT